MFYVSHPPDPRRSLQETVPLINFLPSFPADQPEISLERPIVHSGLDQEAMLICIVHGEPPPEVTTNIQPSPPHLD